MLWYVTNPTSNHKSGRNVYSKRNASVSLKCLFSIFKEEPFIFVDNFIQRTNRKDSFTISKILSYLSLNFFKNIINIDIIWISIGIVVSTAHSLFKVKSIQRRNLLISIKIMVAIVLILALIVKIFNLLITIQYLKQSIISSIVILNGILQENAFIDSIKHVLNSSYKTKLIPIYTLITC